MKRAWNIVWTCYCLAYAALMFAFAGGLVVVPQPLGLTLAAVMLVGGLIHWRASRKPRPARGHTLSSV